MTKRQKRLLTIAIVLAIVLALLGAYYAYYQATKRLSFDVTALIGADTVTPPQFLYSFGGEEGGRLVRPTGVLAYGGMVFVPDAQGGKVQVFTERGVWQRSIGGTESITPLYVARNPKDGNLYVSDRRTRSVHIYSTEGKYLGDFDPNLPKRELPKFETGGVQWVPLALAFGRDGTLYATELLNGHRLLIFGPDGKFKRSVGTAAIVLEPAQAPGLFQFPNGIMVFKNEVFVADSNNRRVQVFDLDGNFKRIIVTQGLPRGIAALGPLPGDDASSTPRFVTVDTLSHDATIWTADGKQVLNFGEQGLLEGQLNYPTGASVGSRNLIFVADTSNGRVQVWGWPDQVAQLPGIGGPSRWPLCLTPLLLLPLLLLRRRRFFATADFVTALIDLGERDVMTSVKRVRWVTVQRELEAMKTAQLPAEIVGLFSIWEHSESDAQALQSRHGLEQEDAIVMSVAQRSRLLCTQDEGLLGVSERLETDAVDADRFVKRFKRVARDKAKPPSE